MYNLRNLPEARFCCQIRFNLDVTRMMTAQKFRKTVSLLHHRIKYPLILTFCLLIFTRVLHQSKQIYYIVMTNTFYGL